MASVFDALFGKKKKPKKRGGSFVDQLIATGEKAGGVAGVAGRPKPKKKRKKK
jgi:hypothetical protein